MSRKLRIAYFVHSLRSDWNNGNAHFLRGLMRSMVAMGHDLVLLEPETGWSVDNLMTEEAGARSLADFSRIYFDLAMTSYPVDPTDEDILALVRDCEIVVLHEWNPPQLARQLLAVRAAAGFRLLFHDTHHRASSTPEQIDLFAIPQFDGVIAFGKSLQDIYRQRYGLHAVWTLHEAADTTVFHPHEGGAKSTDVVWIGNWGDGERTQELQAFLLKPAADLGGNAKCTVYGVRYPEAGSVALQKAGVQYGGYLPNLDAPAVYAAAKLTVHIPRQQYVSAMMGIPTIRVFEALACGIPLVSAPWEDTEELFEMGDYAMVHSSAEMTEAMRHLLNNPAAAAEQAQRGLNRVLERHTCVHRAERLTEICQEVLA